MQIYFSTVDVNSSRRICLYAYALFWPQFCAREYMCINMSIIYFVMYILYYDWETPTFFLYCMRGLLSSIEHFWQMDTTPVNNNGSK